MIQTLALTKQCAQNSTSCLGQITALGLCRSCYKKQYRTKNITRIRSKEKVAYHKNRGRKLQTMRKHKYSPKGRFGYMVQDSKKRGLECTLTCEEYVKLILRPCFYCELPLPPSRCTGLDRIDNKKGYISGNVLPCCGTCNVLRKDLFTVEEMKIAIMAIKEFRKAKKGATLTEVGEIDDADDAEA